MLLIILLLFFLGYGSSDTVTPQDGDVIIANLALPPHGCKNFGACGETNGAPSYEIVNSTNTSRTLEYTCADADCVCVNGTTNSATANCDTLVDTCISVPCANANDTCQNVGIGSFECSFAEDSACAESPCKNGATCSNLADGYSCECADGYLGTNCETKDVCYKIYCQNSGTCVPVLQNSQFYCNCTYGFQGRYCEKTSVTVSTPKYENCWHYQSSLANYELKFSDSKMTVEKCQNYARSFSPQKYLKLFLCETWCAVATSDILNSTAWSTDSGCKSKCPGNSSEKCGKSENRVISYSFQKDVVDPNGCVASTQCNANSAQGICVDQNGTYSCACSPYFSGAECDVAVENACAATENPCQNGGTCNSIAQTNGYTCSCVEGFVGEKCQYPDPCSPSPCLYGSTCSPNPSTGSYTCDCLSLYTGQNCQYLDRCNYSNPCVHGHCSCDSSSIDPSYTCTCENGWNNTNCDTEINYCDSTPCQFNSTCTAFFGGYNCTCLAGLEGNNCEKIIDQCKNHTVNGVGPCNTKDSLANCTTGINTFSCSCSEKWTNTYCDLNILIEQVLVAIYGYMNTDMISLLNDLMSNPSEIKDMVPFITGLLNTTEREDLSWNVEDLFNWVAFEDQRLDLSRDIYKWNDVVLGNCFTFNHYFNNVTYLMRNSGTHGGFAANMRCRQDEYAPWYDTAAINVFIHSRDEYVFSESVRYNAPPNAKSNINIYNTYYTRLGGKYGACVKKASEVKAYYYPLAYTTDGCLRTCYQDMIYAACNCMDPRYPQADNVTTCQLADRTCVTDASDSAGDPSTWKSCLCPLPCSNQQYSVTWSKANFVASPQSCASAANQTACLETYRDSLLVSILLPRLDYKIYAEVPKMDFNKFLSQLGGQLGVLMGINLVSFFEILFLICGLVMVCCKKY